MPGEEKQCKQPGDGCQIPHALFLVVYRLS